MRWGRRRDPEFERASSAVLYLLAEASGFLSAECAAKAEEMLRVGEPDQALELMAWDLASRADDLPGHLVEFIKVEARDVEPLPPVFET